MKRFWRSRDGQLGIVFAISAPMVLGGAGAAVDYAHLVALRSELQAVADGAALTSARELRIAGAETSAVRSVGKAYVAAHIPGDPVSYADEVAADRTRYRVTLSRPIETYVLPASLVPSGVISATAEARVYGGAPVCLLSLRSSGKEVLTVDKAAITANACAVYSNSRHPKGLVIKKAGKIEAAFVCSAGGVAVGGATVKPKPRLDCPVSPDPLAGRPAPEIGACAYTAYKAEGVATLRPGVYCGGLEVDKGAAVTLAPGDYVIKDGALKIDDDSTVTGEGAAFYLTGAGAVFDIKPKTTLRLTAPKTGPLAGMLFYEDPTNAPGKHRINSRNAPVLLGTFYLPVSAIEIGAPGGYGLLTDRIGSQSAWTIVVAQTISVNDGLVLTLNADYDGASVPVPDGLGATQTSVSLTR